MRQWRSFNRSGSTSTMYVFVLTCRGVYLLQPIAVWSTFRYDNLIQSVGVLQDEIRGMARDSRSLRLGLSNAELLARDLNAMQAMVESNNPRASALFWDDSAYTSTHTPPLQIISA
jgi:hypothetical protein